MPAGAGMEAHVFMPSDTPRINKFEAVMAGAKVVLVDGLIADCGRIVRAGNEAMSWFDLSTLRQSTGAPAIVVCPREQGTFPR
jgi:threonine synthase